MGQQLTPSELARLIAVRLGRIEGVAAVALGWLMGPANRASRFGHRSWDYYRAERPPSVEALGQLAHELDDRHPPDAATDFGHGVRGSTAGRGSRSRAGGWTGSTAISG